MTVAIGSDHAGYDLKEFITAQLSRQGYHVIDCGTDSRESVDYPDYARAVCDKVTAGEAPLGILICGTGIGISIAANKLKGIRAALCHTEFSARMARLHNDANVLTLGGRVLGEDLAFAITLAFLGEAFSGGERHRRRIGKIQSFEDTTC